MAKLPREEWDKYLDWLSDYEYQKLGLPQPSATVYLRMPLDTAQSLLSQRYDGDEEKKDIHEKNRSYLSLCHETAAYVAKKWGWRMVECCDQDALLAPKQIEQRIWEVLSDFFSDRPF